MVFSSPQTKMPSHTVQEAKARSFVYSDGYVFWVAPDYRSRAGSTTNDIIYRVATIVNGNHSMGLGQEFECALVGVLAEQPIDRVNRGLIRPDQTCHSQEHHPSSSTGTGNRQEMFAIGE
jgi:hypothetical protein